MGGEDFGTPPQVHPPTFDMLATLVEQHATERSRAESEARGQARLDAGQAAADQR